MNSDIAKTNEKKNTSRLLVNVKVDLYYTIEKTSFTYDAVHRIKFKGGKDTLVISYFFNR